MSETKNMFEIGTRSGTDKVTHHRYDRFYPKFMEFARNMDSKAGMVEIGLDRGASVLMWLEYFKELHIYGIDINKSSYDNSRVTMIQCDQSNKYQLEQVAAFQL